MKLSLSKAAKAAGASKSTLLKALEDGELSGDKGENGIWSIDAAEVARYRETRAKPQRGRRARAPEEPTVKPEAIEIAELRAHLAAAKQRLDDMIARAEAAEAREMAERERVDRLTRQIEDKRPRGFWSRLTGR